MSLVDMRGKSLFNKYAERCGGFQGQRGLGLVMWLLTCIADQMIAGDVNW